MRGFVATACAILAGIGSSAATLEKLDFDDMVAKSTAIVRGRIVDSYTTPRGSLIYTHYRVQVLERWKGSAAATVDVVVHGGTYGAVRQTFSGTPKLGAGGEYVLFLWTGKSGLTHIMGLTQGLFDIKYDSKGASIAVRAASSEMMLGGATGQAVTDQGLQMGLAELRQRIERALASEGAR